MRINHNIAALNTYRQLSSNNAGSQKAIEKLSSGLRINRAGDDAAGLAISEKMRSQIRGLETASRNAQDGISLIQTAEGALNETHSILQRMRELAVQAENGTNTDEDRGALNEEYTALVAEITRIGDDTEFNTKKVLNGTIATGAVSSVGASLVAANGIVDIVNNGASAAADYTLAYDEDTTTLTLSSASQSKSESIKLTPPTGFNTAEIEFASLGITVKVNAALDGDIAATNTFAVAAGSGLSLQIGANDGQSMLISIGDMRSTALGGTTKLNATNVSTVANATAALTSIEEALEEVSAQRSKLGAYQNRLEHTINNLSTSAENLTAAESRIRDVDMAQEMMEFTKNSILMQASQAMLAQANQQPQGVLQLLR